MSVDRPGGMPGGRPSERRQLTRADLPDEFTPETVRQVGFFAIGFARAGSRSAASTNLTREGLCKPGTVGARLVGGVRLDHRQRGHVAVSDIFGEPQVDETAYHEEIQHEHTCGSALIGSPKLPDHMYTNKFSGETIRA